MPRSARATTVQPFVLRRLEVQRVADLTPRMRRVTLTGEQLGAFTDADGEAQPAFASTGFDDDIRLFFPYPGETEPVLPATTAAAKARRARDGEERRPLGRTFTVRRYDPASQELDVDVAFHDAGLAGTWAYRAQPGDRIHIGGPRLSRALPGDVDWLLVAGDETALPAIAHLLDDAPAELRAQVFIEIADDIRRLPLRELSGVTVTWLSRHGAPAGTTTLLVDAVRRAEWWDGAVFAWVAGEQSAVRDLRRHLREDRHLDVDDIDSASYWHRQTVVTRADDAAVVDVEKTTEAFERFHDLARIVPPIAISVAAELGIGDLISRGVTTTGELTARTGSDARALGKLLRYLRTIDLLHENESGEYKLTETGEFLANEFVVDAVSSTGVTGRETLGIFGLAESIRTGRASYASVTGHDFAAVRAEQSYEDRWLTRIARFQAALAQPIAKSDLLAGVSHLVIHSGGAGAQARELTAVHPDLRVTICALPAQADWLRRDLPISIPDEYQRARVTVVEQSVFEPSPAADAVLVSRGFKALPDADAAFALRRAAENLADGGRVLLVEETFDLDEMDEHHGEADLLALTVHGSGMRTDDELAAVITAAGLTISDQRTVGWDITVHVLVRDPAA